MSDGDRGAAAAQHKVPAPPRPAAIALPPRAAVENLFLRGPDSSPGPMTLVSSFFADADPDSECRSFSQLLAGAMASPRAFAPLTPVFAPPGSKFPPPGSESQAGERDSASAAPGGLRFKQNPPLNLVVAAAQPGMFTIPPGLSPASLLESPGFFSPVQGQLGMSHQQALAQVTAQALQSQSHMQAGNPSSLALATATSSYLSNPIPLQKAQPTIAGNAKGPHSDKKYQPSGPAVDKPVDDGYNWRKYGQKQVKGSEYPRSYYKCTHPNCPVKKKVERSLDGQVTEIIYKGQHNHQKPQLSRRGKEGALLPSGHADLPGNVDSHINPETRSTDGGGNMKRSADIATAPSVSRRDQELSHVTTEQLSGSSDGEDVGNAETVADGQDDHFEPDSKRRNVETKVVATRIIESSGPHKTVTEPRIIVQTTSEVDLLDDGYRWRKYGQKVVKGNPHPRSYYKCTSVGCNVRKHVERASTDAKAVITTYEGKHNHEVPTAKNSSHSTTNSGVHQSKPQNLVQNNYRSTKSVELVKSNQQSLSLEQLKEEHSMT